MTSDKKWDPSIFDSDNEPTDDVFPHNFDQLPTEDYDVQGEYIKANIAHNDLDDNESFLDDDVFEDAAQDFDDDSPHDPFWIPERQYNCLLYTSPSPRD